MAGLAPQSILPPKAAFLRGDVLAGLGICIFTMLLFLYGILFGAQAPMLISRASFTIDASIFYAAARAAFVYGHSPYDFTFLGTFPDGAGRAFFGYFYPPPSLFFFWPLALTDYMTGRVLSLLAYCLAALGSSWLLLACAAEHGARQRAIVTIGFLLGTSLCLYNGLAQGQPNCVVFLFLLLFWRALRARRDGLAGAMLALAGLIKFYPFLFALPLLVFRRWRAVKGLAVTVLALSAATTILLPASWFLEWARLILAGGYGATPPGLFPVAAMENISLNGWFARIFSDNAIFGSAVIPAPWLVAPLGYLSAALLLTLAVRHWRGRPWDAETINLVFAQSAFLMFLLAPFSWRHHFIFMAFAMMWLLLMARRFAVFGALAMLWLAFNILAPMPFIRLHASSQVLASGVWVAMMLTFLWFSFRLSDSRTRPRPAPRG